MIQWSLPFLQGTAKIMDRTSWQMQDKHAEPSWIQDIPFGPEAHVGKDQNEHGKIAALLCEVHLLLTASLEKQWAGSKGSEKGHPHPREVFYTHKVLCPHLSLYLLCLITWDFFGNTPTRKYLRETTLQRKWTLHFGPTQKPFEQIWTQTCLNHGNVTYAASQNGKRKCSWR